MQIYKNVLHFSFFSILIILLSLFAKEIDSQTTRLPSKGRSTNVRVLEKEIKDKLLTGGYDKDIRPGGGTNGSDPTEVIVNLFLRSVGSIDDFKMEFTAQLTLREEWNDPRLKFSNLDKTGQLRVITISDMSRVWMPDTFFINEKDSKLHSIIKPNAYVRITPDGTLQFSIRISLTLSCPMDLALFPMDSQKCSITMASYGLTNDDMVFKWKDGEPVQREDLILPRFTLKEINTFNFQRTTQSGNYSCLRAELYLVRNFHYYVIQMYIPCVMLVNVSWVSFFLDENAVPARTGLGITTLLTMATQAAAMKTQSAAVSYTKAMDVWSTTCLAFVFGALMEFAIVDYCRRYDKRKGPSRNAETAFCFPRFSRSSKKVDVTARIVFPASFVLFNIVYWGYYLSQSPDY